ncbi:MAG: phosphoribosylformylglycinamidine cyclo-ligase [Gammaproteobacteria bacterium]|nr:MAG: phosphoribosylformylglycinamidine cyclo-ligase [Gammaproteobacteria bacterium]
MSSQETEGLTYRGAGVDIDAGNRLVEQIKPLVRATARPELLGGIGGFGAMIEIPTGYKQPVLVAGADGVGTKLKLAIEMGVHDTVGIDLVAMCANDILVQGAEPLFFLDYLAVDRLDADMATEVIAGIAEGCKQSGAALAGGETAEMPGMYGLGDYDLAGFCVGVVEKANIIDGSGISAGDRVIGLASSGLHSNGFSLVRKVLERSNHHLAQTFEGGERSLGEVLLAPTRIYVRSLLPLLRAGRINGLSHITGGGLLENIPRILPAGLGVELQRARWPRSTLFDWLQAQGSIHDEEMYRTFNCGIGMVAIVGVDQAESVTSELLAAGEQAWDLGAVVVDNDQAVRIL